MSFSMYDDVPFWSRRLPALLAEAVELYRAAGRPLAGLSEDKLDAGFRSAFRTYAKDQGKPAASRSLNEVAAEYMLRRRAAPLKLVARDLAWLVQPGDLPESVKRLPLVLLAFGRVMWIPGAGGLVLLQHEDEDLSSPAYRERSAAEGADFRWLLGLPAERAA